MDWWHALGMWVGSVLGGFTNWWNTLNIGNLSEAWAAVGSLAVVLVTLWLTYREARKHRYQEERGRILEEAREEREREARVEAVSIRIVDGISTPRIQRNGDGTYGGIARVPAISVEIHNSSTLPIYDVHVCVQPKGRGDHDTFEEALYLTESLGSQSVVASGETIEGIEKPVDELSEDPSGKTRPTMGLRFRDVRHNQWWRSENGELHYLGNSWLDSSKLGMRLRALDKAHRPLHRKAWDGLRSIPQKLRNRWAIRWLRRHAAELTRKRQHSKPTSPPAP
ncbi:hypothetical protein [Micrococcus luteus]|uniref:hypothetical protein n=1 Tax=Micrococcus luteus TaxID=1270 RepID=UPI0034DB2CBC